jgi:hypothetical protein
MSDDTTPTSTRPESADDQVVIPQITMPAGLRDQTEALGREVEALRPTLERLHDRLIKAQAANDTILLEWARRTGEAPGDDVLKTVEAATGWGSLWVLVNTVLGEPFSDQELATSAYKEHELLRGEKDFPAGTTAEISDDATGKVLVRVRRFDPSADRYGCDEVGGDRAFWCSHEEVRGGLVSLGDPMEEGARRLREAGLVAGE